MMLPTARQNRRPGAHLVEFAVVSIFFFLILFGILEYGRLVMIINLMDNAAREGARYAVVNTNQGSSLTANTRGVVVTRLANIQTALTGFVASSAITIKA